MKCERCKSPSAWRYGAIELCDPCLPVVRRAVRWELAQIGVIVCAVVPGAFYVFIRLLAWLLE